MTRRKTSKHNKHWGFVRDTFRQIYLAKAFTSGSRESKTNNVDGETDANEAMPVESLSPSKPLSVAAKLYRKQEAHRRRRLFLQKVLAEEAFICKTLGMDHSGMCIRHPDQYIFQIPQHESIFKTSYSKIGKAVEIVNTCRICRSEACYGTKNGGVLHRHKPGMIGVVKEIQQLQSDRTEWKKRTNILGMKTSHHGDSIRCHARSMQLKRSANGNAHLDNSNGDGNGNGNGDGDGDGDGDAMDDDSETSEDEFCSMTPDEWVEFARFRILQVRSWEDRFAIKNHPIFCHYFKMLQFGVPLEAVKFHVTIDGYPSSIMDLNPNRSLELQLDQLDETTLETLRFLRVLNNSGRSSKDNGTNKDCGNSMSDDSNYDDWNNPSINVSIPDTMQRLLSAFQRRRSNQIFATSALFDETKYTLEERKNNKASITKYGNQNHSATSLVEGETGRIRKGRKGKQSADLFMTGSREPLRILQKICEMDVGQKKYSPGEKNRQWRSKSFDASNGRCDLWEEGPLPQHFSEHDRPASQRSSRGLNLSSPRRRYKVNSSKQLERPEHKNRRTHQGSRCSEDKSGHQHRHSDRSSRKLDERSGHKNRQSQMSSRKLDYTSGSENHRSQRSLSLFTTSLDGQSANKHCHNDSTSGDFAGTQDDSSLEIRRKHQNGLKSSTGSSFPRRGMYAKGMDLLTGVKQPSALSSQGQLMGTISASQNSNDPLNEAIPDEIKFSMEHAKETNLVEDSRSQSHLRPSRTLDEQSVQSTTTEESSSSEESISSDESSSGDEPPIKEIILFDMDADYSSTRTLSIELELDALLKRESGTTDYVKKLKATAYDDNNDRVSSIGQSIGSYTKDNISSVDENVEKMQDKLMDALSIISERNTTIDDLREDLKRKEEEINDLRRQLEEMNHESSERRRRKSRRRHNSNGKTRNAMNKNKDQAIDKPQPKRKHQKEQKITIRGSSFTDENDFNELRHTDKGMVHRDRDACKQSVKPVQELFHSWTWSSNNSLERYSSHPNTRMHVNNRSQRSRSHSNGNNRSRVCHVTKAKQKDESFSRRSERSEKSSFMKDFSNNGNGSRRNEHTALSVDRSLEREPRNGPRSSQRNPKSHDESLRSLRSRGNSKSPVLSMQRDLRSGSSSARNHSCMPWRTSKSPDRSIRSGSHRSRHAADGNLEGEAKDSPNTSFFTTNLPDGPTSKNHRYRAGPTDQSQDESMRSMSRRSQNTFNSQDVKNDSLRKMIQQRGVNNGSTEVDLSRNSNYKEILAQCFERLSKDGSTTINQENASLNDTSQSFTLHSADRSAAVVRNNDIRLSNMELDKSLRQRQKEGIGKSQRRSDAEPVVAAVEHKRRRKHRTKGTRKKHSKKATEGPSLLTRGSNSIETDHNTNPLNPGEDDQIQKEAKDAAASKDRVIALAQPRRTMSALTEKNKTADRVAFNAHSRSKSLSVEKAQKMDGLAKGSFRGERKVGGIRLGDDRQKKATKEVILNLFQNLIDNKR
eukprot:CAMPEP_0172379366 /NCGR_PEP_ID=MMETSP1060-20121228/69895_1 /TAXON_ID=37318 /ORGANISM="Pseudo-nitzschia pungens, Strain cf. cingulata" /LENGTH=1489 /DNA_ID=CAMNT_0013107107 /DNA_START=196 /DNA_END=4665 /DNA_ORIENTATION=+